ncbi:flagellar basal body-associated FliL family protein [Halobacteriovorax sp. DPLXC-1]|uniref:flagellar basal body-associated FliL family protein n=1 Tax=Halobacteriovorax sp. DPLXC-1 TaxID=3110771 RepID=UPI002FF00811
MMDKWVKLENLINGLLIKLVNFFKKLTPNSFKNTYLGIKNSISKFFTTFAKIPLFFKENGKRWFMAKLAIIISFLMAKKESAAKLVASLKGFKLTGELPLLMYKSTQQFVSKNIVAKVAALSPAKAVGLTCTLTVFSLGGISVYQNVKEIADKTSPKQVRKIASVSKEDKERWGRTRFRNIQKQRIFLRNVYIPIYIKNRNGMKNLQIDVSLKTNNRYTARYFYKPENEIMIRDRLNSSLQAVVPNFPLEPEGKKIIKEKIRREVNHLIEDLKIEGRVDEVFIHSILNG